MPKVGLEPTRPRGQRILSRRVCQFRHFGLRTDGRGLFPSPGVVVVPAPWLTGARHLGARSIRIVAVHAVHRCGGSRDPLRRARCGLGRSRACRGVPARLFDRSSNERCGLRARVRRSAGLAANLPRPPDGSVAGVIVGLFDRRRLSGHACGDRRTGSRALCAGRRLLRGLSRARRRCGSPRSRDRPVAPRHDGCRPRPAGCARSSRAVPGRGHRGLRAVRGGGCPDHR